MEMMKYKLGDVCTFINGRAYSQPELLDSGKYKVLRVGNIFDGNHWYYSDMELEEDKYCNEGDLLYSWACTFGPYIWHGPKTIYHYHIWKVKQNDSLVDKRFLYYFLNHQTKGFMGSTHGSTMIHITKENMENFEVLLPSLKNQKKIASVLSTLDDKIALNKKMNQKLERMAKRLYDYWFVQYDFPDKNGKPYKTSGGKMVYNDQLKREIPAGWDVKRLGDLFKTNRGVSYSTPTLGENGDGAPMINLASFSPNESYNEKGIKYYKGDYTAEKILKPFDFVMCNTQQTAIDPSKDIIGRSMLIPDIFDGDIVSSHHVNTIKLEKENLKFYLNRLFNTKFYHSYISKFANGTNILGLIFSGVEDYLCEIPTDELLDKFANISLNIEKKKSKIIRENQELTSLRDRLLPLLMNGQVSVENLA